MDEHATISMEQLDEPLIYPAEAYISREYAEAEGDRLWSRVWQHAGRVEEIPQVGDYITYDIGNDSILIVRTADDEIRAYFNVCPHRGRKLVGTPGGANQACGHKEQSGKNLEGFFCACHGWTFDMEGKATFILDKEDWKGALTEERTSLKPVQVDTWGGWIWINMDPNCRGRHSPSITGRALTTRNAAACCTVPRLPVKTPSTDWVLNHP